MLGLLKIHRSEASPAVGEASSFDGEDDFVPADTYGEDAYVADAPRDDAATADRSEPSFKELFNAESPEPEEVSTLRARLAEYEPFDNVIQQLRETGLKDGQEVENRIAENQWQQHEQQAIQQRLGQVVQELQGRIDQGELTVEQAEGEYARQENLVLREREADRYLQEREALAFDTAMANTLHQFPTLKESGGDEFVRYFAAMNGIPPENLGQVVHAMLTQHGERVLASHFARETENDRYPTLAGGSGGAPPATPGARASHDVPWTSLFGVRS